MHIPQKKKQIIHETKTIIIEASNNLPKKHESKQKTIIHEKTNNPQNIK